MSRTSRDGVLCCLSSLRYKIQLNRICPTDFSIFLSNTGGKQRSHGYVVNTVSTDLTRHPLILNVSSSKVINCPLTFCQSTNSRLVESVFSVLSPVDSCVGFNYFLTTGNALLSPLAFSCFPISPLYLSSCLSLSLSLSCCSGEMRQMCSYDYRERRNDTRSLGGITKGKGTLRTQ